MEDLLAQARHWRMKAAEYRAVADQMKNPMAKDAFWQMAETYDRLAETLEQRAAGAAMPKKPEAG